MAKVIADYINAVGGYDGLSGELERPRFRLLAEACKTDDFFYVALHQLFCLWTNNRRLVTSLENFSDPKIAASAFRILAQLIQDNDHLSLNHLNWLCEFPSPLADLMRRSDHYHKTVMSVVNFLEKLVSEWGNFTKDCQQRGHPPLVDEMIHRLGLTSPILQRVVFTATRRSLFIQDEAFGASMEQLFVQDQEGFKKLAVRYNTAYPATVRENHERSTRLVLRYRELLEQRRQQQLSINPPILPSSNSAGVYFNGSRYSPAHSPQIPQQQFGLPQHGIQTTYGAQQQFVGQQMSRRGSVAAVRNPPTPSCPGNREASMYIQPPFSNSRIQNPAAIAAIPPQHAGTPNQPPNQARNVNKNPVQLPNQPPGYQQPGLISRNQSNNRTSDSQAVMSDGYQIPMPYMYTSPYHGYPNQHVRQLEPQQLPPHQARQQQLQWQMPASQTPGHQQMPHLIRAYSNDQNTSQHAQSHRLQGTSPISRNVRDAQHMNIPRAMAQIPAEQTVHSAVGTQENPSRRSLQTTALPYFGEGVIQYYGNSNPKTRPLIPPHGFVHPVLGPPNPDLTALHQAHLRSPYLQVPQSSIISSQDTQRIRYYQSVARFALGPSVIPVEQTLFKERFEISSTDFAKIAATAATKKDSLAVRDASVGSLQYRLRFSRLKNNVSEISEAEWTTSETTWPESIFLEINKTPLEIRRKNLHGKDLAVDITQHVTIGQNDLRVAVVRIGKAKQYTGAIAVEIIEVLQHVQIIDMCLESRHIPADETLNTIKAVLTGAGSDDDEIAMQASDLTIDLADPFTARIFDIPVRGAACLHRECFDLETFLQTRNSKPKRPEQPSMVDVWKCPLCDKDARPHTLRVDDFLVEVRKRLGDQALLDTKAIIVASDGSWRPKPMASALKRTLKDGVHDGEDDDGDSDAKGPNKRVKVSAEPAKQIEVIELDDD